MPAPTPSQPETVKLTVDGLTYGGLAFGLSDAPPLLALHGWQDNANSFRQLAQALPDFRLVALDLSGHGLSDHRSADATYQIWDDLPQLVGILDALGWDRCTLLGHSRGAIISTLLAAALPERVSALITLDSMLPAPTRDDDFVTTLRAFLKDRAKLLHRPPRHFASEKAFVERRSLRGEPPLVSAALAERALHPCEEGLAYRNDPRHNGASAVKLNEQQCNAVLRCLSMPVLNIWATPRHGMEQAAARQRSAIARHVANFTTVDIPGHHHWHMEEAPAKEIALAIREFLRHATTD